MPSIGTVFGALLIVVVVVLLLNWATKRKAGR
jgi:hypothetical protein